MSRGVLTGRGRPTTLPPLTWHDTEVVAIRELTPRMHRVTLAGETLRDFVSTGPDEHCKLVLPRRGDRLPSFDRDGNVFEQWRAMPGATRPHLLTYTIRALRPQDGEVDIDFAIHTPGGPAMHWLEQAGPGSPLAIFGTRGEFDPPVDADSFLLLADPAGLPALAAILEALPREATVLAVAEVGGMDEELELELGADMRVVWAHRGASEPFGALTAALAAIALPGGSPYVWAAGEATALGGARRHLVEGRGIPAARCELVGYWRVGGVPDPD